ncbi:hypothetical protein [Polaromonas sp. AET17H-212]|uniref:hypothetical protein n=1 Tax=Polaromonas sp. AET17H-212 TaxID=1977061 RepID=UPI001141408A|nr:hypothetical protein [Polaromonas sp. AET17H-212]
MKSGFLLSSADAHASPSHARASAGDLAYAALILAAGMFIGQWFTGSGIVKAFHFYQETFAPAVMVACGHEFAQPVPEPQAMTEYLAAQRPVFACADIPASVAMGTPTPFQQFHKYLLLVVAGAWKLGGVSWAALQPLYGLVLGLTGLAAYALCRSAMGRPLSLVCAGLMMLSPLQLFNLPHLRDYIKAPFFLGVLALLVWQLRAEKFSRSSVAWSALAGILTGIGMGFRIDLVTLAPLYLLAIFLFFPDKLAANFLCKGANALAFMAALTICAAQVVGGSQSGGMSHVLVLGLMGEFDPKLGLAEALYGLGHHYLDMYASTLLNGYAVLHGYGGGVIEFPTPEYGRLGAQYYADIAATFPADMATRFLAAAWKILHLPVTAFVTYEDLYFFYDDFIDPKLWAFTHHRIWDLVSIGVLASALLIILRRGLRLGMAAMVILLFMAGYPFLQFGVRHYFYLQVVGLWLTGLVLQTWADKLGKVWAAYRSGSGVIAALGEDLRVSWKVVLIQFSIFFVVLPALIFFGLRAYQSKHTLALFESYASAKTEPLAGIERIRSGDLLRMAPQGLFAPLGSPLSGVHKARIEFLVADFDQRRCGRDSVHVKYTYEFNSPVYDFNQRVSLGIDQQTRVVFPVFQRDGHFRFAGVEMPATEAPCLVDLTRIADPQKLKLPLTFRFPGNWRDLPRYREIAERP